MINRRSAALQALPFPRGQLVHARNEDKLLYQWADDRLEHAEKESVLRSFAERFRARLARPARVGTP